MFGKLHLLLPPSAAAVTDALGLDSHLESLSRGVLDSRDAVYYASLTGFFLHLAHLRLSSRQRRR